MNFARLNKLADRIADRIARRWQRRISAWCERKIAELQRKGLK